jgi:hypothetical protein
VAGGAGMPITLTPGYDMRSKPDRRVAAGITNIRAPQHE